MKFSEPKNRVNFRKKPKTRAKILQNRVTVKPKHPLWGQGKKIFVRCSEVFFVKRCPEK